jgi:hypothetical protein
MGMFLWSPGPHLEAQSLCGNPKNVYFSPLPLDNIARDLHQLAPTLVSPHPRWSDALDTPYPFRLTLHVS